MIRDTWESAIEQQSRRIAAFNVVVCVRECNVELAADGFTDMGESN